MRVISSLNLLLALCLAARGEESFNQKNADHNEVSSPLLMVSPSFESTFQQQPVMMGRNNLNFFFPAFTSIVTTTSTVTCTYSTAAQCFGRRRRELMVESQDKEKSIQEEAGGPLVREDRNIHPAYFLDPYYTQYHPRYLIEPSFERSSYYHQQRRFNPFVPQQPELARFLFGVRYTFTSTSTTVTTSSWRPVCSFPGNFQNCPS